MKTALVLAAAALALAGCSKAPAPAPISVPANQNQTQTLPANVHHVADMGTCDLYRVTDGETTLYVTTTPSAGSYSSMSCSITVKPK